MDFGGVPKASAVGTSQVASRIDVSSTPGGAPVELAPAKTVQSATAGEAVRLDLRALPAQRPDPITEQRQRELRQVIERHIEVDPRSRSLVLRKVDAESGETVGQYPEEAILQLRAMARELRQRAAEGARSLGQLVERTA